MSTIPQDIVPYLSRTDQVHDSSSVLEPSSSVVTRETASSSSSSSSTFLPDGSVTRRHARTLSGSLRLYAASWIPPQLQAAASNTAGRMTPTGGLKIPGLPSLSRRTSPAMSATSSPSDATDKESEGMCVSLFHELFFFAAGGKN